MKQGLSRAWAPIDWLVEQVQNGIDTVIQQRVAMLMILASFPLLAYGPFSGEPLLIYLMSAIALTMTGITWLAGLQATRTAEEAAEGSQEHQAAAAGEIPPPVP